MLREVAMKLLQLELDGTDTGTYKDYLHLKLRQTNAFILTLILSDLLNEEYFNIDTYMKRYLYKIHRFIKNWADKLKVCFP